MVAELTDLGARVDVVACDVTDRGAVRGVIESIPEDHRLTGVVHTAGVLDDALIADQTADRFDTVLRPKADAVEVLDAVRRV